MICPNCNQIISDDSTFCNQCGNRITPNPSVDLSKSQEIPTPPPATPYVPKDDPSTIVGIISCCLPIVGIVLYLVWKDDKPKSAKQVCYWTLGGVIAGVVLYFIFLALGFAFAANTNSYMY